MAQGRVVLIGSSPTMLDGSSVQTVLSTWNSQGPPDITRHTLTQILHQPELLDNADIAWLRADARSPEGLYDVIALLQDRQIPAALSRPQEHTPAGAQVQEGIVALPLDSDPQIAGGVLRALASQRPALRELHNEIEMLRRQQAGLTGQMDRIDEELRLASQLQRELLPAHLPKVPGIDLGVLYRPATYVSGDTYDVIRLDEDHVGLFIADAVGHGVPAALMTVYIKQALFTKEIGPSFPRNYRLVPPGETLARLNTNLLDMQGGSVRTATAIYALFNLRTNELRYARAGHPLPILLHADGSTQPLDHDGALLGVFPDETFAEAVVPMRPGDRLLFYSDGFETAFAQSVGDRTQQTGLASTRYYQEFGKLAQGTMNEALTALGQRLDQQAGSLNQIDDMTVVALGIAR